MKKPPVARTNFDWPEEFRGIVTGYPVDAHCVADWDCDEAVEWHADYHGCAQELLCSEHLSDWSYAVLDKLRMYGSVVCMTCGGEFTDIRDYVAIRTA